MALPTYSTGTVSIDADGTTATGTGTIWMGGNAREGDDLVVNGVLARIVDVVSATELTITKWTGGAVAAVGYTILQNASRRVEYVQITDDLGKQVAALNTEGFYHFVPPTATDPDPSLGDEGQYAFQATTGKLWLKSGGAWVFVGVYKGVNPRGAWSSVTNYEVNDVVSDLGNAYMATAPNINDEPPSAKWMQLGAAGADGSDGTAATVDVGTTATGAPGSAAVVTNSGTTSAAILDFTIPTGKGYGATSTSSVAIGTGAKTFAIQTGLAYVPGDRVHIGAVGSELNWMEGFVTFYVGTSMAVAVSDVGGSGTFEEWGIGLTGKPGSGDGDMKAANYASEYVGHGPAVRTNLGFSAIGEALATASDAAAARKATVGAVRSITGADTIIASDIGKTLLAGSSSAFTLAIAAAATLGSGFWCDIRNIGTALITLDPNSSETVDGKSTLTIGLGEAMRVVCDGTAFYTDASRGKMVELGRVTNPNAAQVDFDFASGWPADFDGFEIHLVDVSPATDDVYLGMRIKTTGSLTVQTSGYAYVGVVQGQGGAANTSSTTDSVSDRISLTRVNVSPAGNGIGNNTGEVVRGTIAFPRPGAGNVTQAGFAGSYSRSDAVVQQTQVTGYYGSTSAWTGVRLFMSVGNILNGTIILYGRRK